MLAILCLAFQWVVAALLLLAFTGKLLSGVQANAEHVRNYRVVPGAWSNGVAAVLPPVELALGLGLLLRLALGVSVLVSAGLFLAFASVMTLALLRGVVTQCGCYGTLHSAQVSWKLVVRNGVIAVLLVATTAVRPVTPSVLHVSTTTTWALYLSAFLAGLALSQAGSSLAHRSGAGNPIEHSTKAG